MEKERKEKKREKEKEFDGERQERGMCLYPSGVVNLPIAKSVVLSPNAAM